MTILVHKLSNERHILRIQRRDGSAEERELETRSLLVHDLIHFAFESEAGINYGFWGLLASGLTMAMLYDNENPLPENAALAQVETLVAPLQSLWHGRMAREQYMSHAMKAAPTLITEPLIDATLEHMRRLWGLWNATRYGETMTLNWDSDRQTQSNSKV